ncbi:YkgJ family cysteine cluster protein [Desulfobotulus sp. H1]|uniref:YkgJ family cysteine cluster protein n=1 Tax=Desulfobotulus pelophilus TaxID=2823377 RepID=A0ABT3NBY9_9BACT|nr:YkgJ family cysteine cluster protein [Desulfobotulus pelophilus]MCW7754974.1 YkgJ family cysteine cluster protein [Desulfobotulus pelophilus]
MIDQEFKNQAVPVQLTRDSRFCFDCHPGVSCFTDCCRKINIMLTPYDIIRMKNRLDISSDEFLAVYTEPRILEKTGLPVPTMRLLDDEKQSCPFVRDEEGCLIYSDRPSACRYYPIGMATRSHVEETGDDFFFMINEDRCKGHQEEKEWTVGEWRMDQGVDKQDMFNEGWTELVVRKKSFGMTMDMTEKSRKLFFMVCYNIDGFRRFVFESDFLKVHTISEDIVEKIKKDEIALLQFGFDWLRALLFQLDPEGRFTPKEGRKVTAD